MQRSSPKIAPPPPNEARRLAALREAALLDTPPEREFDDIAALAAEICGTPIALVSLIDEIRQWFKARVGLEVRETPRDVSFCAHALDLDDLLVVPDATADPRFAENPLVRDAPCIRFYAGMPLKTETGETLGTLCVIDRSARQLTERERRALRALAGTVISLIRLRRSEAAQRDLAAWLAEERQRLTDSQAVAKIGSWETDLSDLSVRWSDETHRIFGTDPGTFIPTHASFLAIVHPDDREGVDTVFRNSLGSRTPQSLDHRIVLPDGQVKIVAERWQVFYEDDGRPIRAVGTCQDVTESLRMKAERDRLYELSIDLLCVAGFDGQLQQVSPAWTRVLGWSEAELTSRPMLEFIHPDDHEITLRVRAAIREGHPARGFENRYRAKDGSYRWLSWNVQPFASSRQVFAVARDVTAEKQAAEQMRLLDACVSHLNDIVVITEAEPIDEPGPRIIYVNEAFERVTGYTRQEAIGRNPRFLQGAHTERTTLDAIRAALKNRQSLRTELVNYTKSGRAYWLELEIVPVLAPNGRATHAIAIERDITERKLAEEKLRESEALLRMAAQVSRMGAWKVDLPDFRLTWSEVVGAIHETPPGFTPPVEAGINFYAPEYRERLRGLFTACIQEGLSFDDELQIITTRGRRVWVRVLGEAVRDAAGAIIRVQGAIEDISERKAQEQETQRLVARLGQTLESITDAFLTVDTEWRFSFLNSEAERLLHRSRADLLGRNIWTEFPAAAGSVFQEKYEQAISERVTVGFEAFFEPLAVWFYIRAYPSDQGLAVYFRDITAERRAAEELQRSSASLVGIVEALQEIGKSDASATEVMTLIARRAQALTGAAGAVVEMVTGDEMEYRAASGAVADKLGLRVPMHGSLSGLAVTSGLALACDDTESDPRVDRTACRAAGIRSMIVAPLRDAGGPIGVLKVMADRPGAFAQRDLKNLEILVASLGAAIQRRQAAERLRASEAQYRMLFAGNPHPMITIDDTSSRILVANSAAMRRYGYTEAEFRALTLPDLGASDDDRPGQLELKGLPRGPHASGRVRHRTKQGEVFDAEIMLDDVLFEGRQARLLLIHDVTERVRAENAAARAKRALLMHSRCTETLIRTTDEDALLKGVCAIAVETGGFAMAWVGYAQDDEAKTILPRAFAGAEGGYLSRIKLSWSADNPAGCGPAGTAIRTGQVAIAADVAATAGFFFREEALRHGFHGVVALPLLDDGRAFGLLVLYLTECVALPEEEIRVLQNMADDLAFGIRSLQVRTERRRTYEAVLAMSRGISSAVGRDFFHQLTRSMVEALGAAAGFVAKVDPERPGFATTLCALEGASVAPDFSCDLAELPGDPTDEPSLWLVARDASRRFPNWQPLLPGRTDAFVGKKLVDSEGRLVGLMVVLFLEPLTRPEFVGSLLRVFAARAASEIERQAAEAKTREQAALLDKARDAIILRDLSHRVTYWNKGAESLYGWTVAEATGRSIVELLYPDPEQFHRAQQQVRRAGEWTGQLTHRHKAGRLIAIEGRWTLVRDDSGKPRSVLAINTDISERKAMEQQLLRSQRMESIGTLAGGIAHDLNNLLAPITMGVDLLRRDPSIQPRYGTIIDNIKLSSDRGANLVRQVLSFARGIESDKVVLNVRHIIREVESMMENSFPKNISIAVTVPNDLAPIIADPTQINQVLLNLCVNARDAMPKGGRLAITARETEIDAQYAAANHTAKPGRYLCVEVSDSGSGMTSEVQARIFEPFYTTKEFGKGTGIGLATVLGIVRSHGGFIDVASHVGHGSTFKVYLPLQSGVVETARTAVEGDAPPLGKGELVLVVDDESAIREVTRQTLEASGYQVLTAEDGAQAICLYAEHRERVAVVLTDMMMPVMDGAALVRALRRLDASVRVVAASGFDGGGRTAATSRLGIRHMLAKPYSANALLTTVRAAIEDADHAGVPDSA